MKKRIFKYTSYIIIIFLILEVVNSIYIKIKLTNNNEEFIKLLLNDKKYYELYIKDYNSILNKTIKLVLNLDLKDPVNILENNFNYKTDDSIKVMYSTTASDNKQEKNENSKYIEDPKKEDVDNPLVYIYNTHQLESYNKKIYEDYNITPNVMMASYILRENLNNKKINTIVETGNIKDFLNANGWDYSNSYKASRYYIKDTLKKYPNLKLIIDLHRDSVSKKATTVVINNKKYAKVLFVVGLEHKNYKQNLETANKLNSIINKKYPNLSRGILKKEGKYVNGIYNQDLNKNIVLIEFGGVGNTIEEVMNTSIAMSDIIKEYVEG